MFLIDNIFSNTNKEYDKNYIHINNITDNFPIYFQLKIYFLR